MEQLDNADTAIEKARAFLLEKYPLRGRVATPVKAALEDGLWVVEFDVGIVKSVIATIKLDATNSDVMEYDVPVAAAVAKPVG